MTLAAFSLPCPRKRDHPTPAFFEHGRSCRPRALLVMFLAFTPDGVAEPLQALVQFALVVGAVAALAVTAMVKGLERLLDCETD